MPRAPSASQRRTSPSSTGVDLDTEGGRAFFQERLAFFGKVGFIISFGFFVFGSLVVRLRLGPTLVRSLGIPPVSNVFQLGADGILLAVWLVCRRGRLRAAALGAIDAGATFLVCLAPALPLLFWPAAAWEFKHATLLVVTNVLIARAVFVPSDARRTFRLSLASVAPTMVVAQGLQSALGPADFVKGTVFRIDAILWCLCAVAVATVTSRVIYGLREKVRQARQLGQYTLEERLGEGGMGVVYRARHAMLRRPTAVKLLPLEKAGEGNVRRFEREVQVTALLSHPNTVSIFDYGRTPDGIFYYVMEYLEGINLEGLVREHGPQPPGRVVHVLMQVCGSLGEAHGVGLIHRDVKPANIILCQRGGVPDVAKVVDFGLVKDLEQVDALSRTSINVITGTPLYLAPEAITAPERVDARSDLYAVGAVGYFLLAGKNVFGGGTLVEICSHHLHTRPESPSARLGRPLPPKLEAAILSCLEKDPARRPANAQALAAALSACDDVETWSDAQAREWWARNEPRIRRPREPGAAVPSEGTMPTLSIDLEERLAGGVRDPRPVG